MIIEHVERRLGTSIAQRLRWTKRLFLAAVCLWLAWGAILRMTRRAHPRPFAEADIADLRPKTDRPDVTDQLRKTMAYFKTCPVFCPDAWNGPWEPQRRPELRAIIKYITSPKTRQALDRLFRIADGSLAIPPEELYARDLTWYTGITYSTYALGARIRMRWTNGDLDGACEDVRALWAVARMYQEQPDFYLWGNGISVEGQFQSELLPHLLMERPPDGGHCDRLSSDFEALDLPGREAYQRALLGDHRRALALMDGLFVSAPLDGDWLDLAGFGEAIDGWHRSPWWNLGSVFFPSRGQVESRLAELNQAALDAGDADWTVAEQRISRPLARVEEVSSVFQRFAPRRMDIELNRAYSADMTTHLPIQRIVRQMVRVGLGLAAYRAERGHYPDTLGQLVPEFLDELPKNHGDGSGTVYHLVPGGFVLSYTASNHTPTPWEPGWREAEPHTSVPGMTWSKRQKRYVPAPAARTRRAGRARSTGAGP